MRISPHNRRGFTLIEMLVTVAVGSMVIGFIFLSYINLQRKFAFAINWSEARLAQTRVLDSMAQDLRNATAIAVSGTSLPLTLTIPARFSGYESVGALAGDPQVGGTLTPLVVSSTTGKVIYPGGTITVTYEKSGNSINRRVTLSGVTPDPVRTVGTFGGGVSVTFLDRNGAAYTAKADTLVPTVSATTGGFSASKPVTTVMTDTVFLRAAVSQPMPSPSPTP